MFESWQNRFTWRWGGRGGVSLQIPSCDPQVVGKQLHWMVNLISSPFQTRAMGTLTKKTVHPCLCCWPLRPLPPPGSPPPPAPGGWLEFQARVPSPTSPAVLLQLRSCCLLRASQASLLLEGRVPLHRALLSLPPPSISCWTGPLAACPLPPAHRDRCGFLLTCQRHEQSQEAKEQQQGGPHGVVRLEEGREERS